MLFENNITLIRIDIPYYKNEYLLKMREAIGNVLSFLFDFSNVDWDLVYSSVYKNTKKLVCDYYMNNKQNHIKIKDMASIFNVNVGTITLYLKEGCKYGWCDYRTPSEIKKERYWNVINYFNLYLNISTKDLANYFNYTICSVQGYLNEGNKNGDCMYNGSYRMAHANTKPIAVYKDGVELMRYDSIQDCIRNSIKDFGVLFKRHEIDKSLKYVNKNWLYEGCEFKSIE